MASPPPPPPHIVIFPFMSQGHTLPLLDLSKALSRRGLKVTIITTPSNAISILPYISKHPQIHLTEIPFPLVEGLPKGCENTAHLPSMDALLTFFKATTQLQQPFEQILREMSEDGSLPICVISDFFLGWTLTTCRLFGIPRLVFHGMGVLAMAIAKTIWVHEAHLMAATDSEPLHFPGLTLPFTLNRSELVHTIGIPDHNDSFSRFLSESGEFEVDSWGVVVNSFVELEGEYMAALESFYRNGAKAWCVGPLLVYNDMEQRNEFPSDGYIKWLDEKSGSGSVICVAFGTQAYVSDMQLDELAFGLEMSGHPFIWVIRSRTWAPPDGWEERVKGRGLIIRDWVEQKCVLAHSATGGFLSHCGWNSVLESLSRGVPILAWPMMAEQPLNAKFVVEGLEAGIWVSMGLRLGDKLMDIGRERICDGVMELMGGEKGRKAKERAEAIGRNAREAVQKGGSAYKSLSELIEHLSSSDNGNGSCPLI